MGVDISTYRCRVGRFVPHHDMGVICLPMNFSQLIKIIRAVSFVKLLLVMAGIEENPGPRDQFLFRYQYLLIEIVTKVVREIFDVHVGHDFPAYLNSNSAASKTLTSLMNTRKITADQEKLLPPKEQKPNTSMYDITLLSCLLRNVCGLSPAGDQVWMNPLPTDHSIEADITRLRKCRNGIMHIDTLCISEKELNGKWQELEEILNRLNGAAKIGNLLKMISDAEFMDIDEELKQRYHETIKAWVAMDCSVDKIQQDVAGLNTRVEHMENTLQGQLYLNDLKDIQKYLVDFYRRCCKTLPVSPLFQNKDENLLSIFKYPTMYCVKCNGEETTEKKEIKCFEDILCKDGRVLEEIFIIGDAGVGKTSFCTCMSLLWCYTKSEDKLGDKYEVFRKDVEYMSKFEFVFFVSLRDTCHTHVVDMIIEQLFGNNKEKYPIIDVILRDKRTLILMDGLDEWVPSQVAGKKTYALPGRIYSKNCVYVTTTRPYGIESVRLSRKDVDRLMEIKGISGESFMSYIKDVIKNMNKENSANMNLTDFISDMKKCKLDDELRIPIIASHVVVLWFYQTLTDMPRALIYANILEMLFKRAEKRGIDIPPSAESKFQHLPDSLSGLKYLNKYISLLYNVCHLSFRSLFKQDENASNLVFTEDQLQEKPYCFTDAETDFLCKIGILSKNEVLGCFPVEKLKISFIHENFIEFFQRYLFRPLILVKDFIQNGS